MKVLPYGRSRRLGQIAAVILVALAVFLFFAAVGVHYAQKQIIKTKARIAADAGALYLGSIIGSYAHYLSKLAVKGKCKKKKRRWGILAWAVAIVVAVITYGAGAHISAAIIAAASTGSFALNEVQVSKAIGQLNKQFKKLSSLDVKRSLKWQTISYVVPLVVEDPGAMDKLEKDIDKVINGVKNGSGGTNISKREQDLENDLKDFWKNNVTPLLVSLTNRTSLFNSIKDLDSVALDSFGNSYHFLIQNRSITECVQDKNGDCKCPDINGNGECDDREEITTTTLYNDIDYADRLIQDVINVINGGASGGQQAIEAWDFMYDSECRDDGTDCANSFDGLKQLEKTKTALADVQTNILNNISGINGLTICDTGCTGIQISYTGDPITTMDEIINHIREGNSIYMSSSDFYNFKMGYFDRLQDLKNAANKVKNKILNNSNFADRVEAVEGGTVQNVPGIPEHFSYAWDDKLGRHHSIEVYVDFKMPKIKVKKHLTSVTIKVKRCEQDVKVTVVRNGYRFTSKMHYKATKTVDDKHHWYLH